MKAGYVVERSCGMEMIEMEKNRALYLDCSTGISGDMSVAALLDLGADGEELKDVLKGLPVEGYSVQIDKVERNGQICHDFAVKLAEENHDHNMEYLYGYSREEYRHSGHSCRHSHGRPYREIVSLLQNADLPLGARKIALKIFDILAEAEAKAHNVPKDDVHFHEAGAVDSIVDVVAAAFCLDNLQVEDAFIANMTEGVGTVRCQHGVLNIPVPAVRNIVESYHLPMHQVNRPYELITPTGAAIAAALKKEKTIPNDFRILRSGFGAGKRPYIPASVLRIDLIEY